MAHRNNTKIKVRSYTSSGDASNEYYFNNIKEALEKYVEIRNAVPNFWNRQSYWPTIWVNSEDGFVRVHGFAFEELTEETIEKYLDERIINNDDVLQMLKEREVKINYQIMDEGQKNRYGKYIPDFEKLIAGATCEEETAYIKEVQERTDKWLNRPGCESYAGFAYNMVYITRQKCGHFEIFQTPCNEHYSLEENLNQAADHAEKMNCTRCITGIGGRS